MHMISAGIHELRALAFDAKKTEDGSRVYDLSIGWGVLMSGRLRRLEHYLEAGELTDDQERRYRDLRRELRSAQPLTERLGIARPDVPPEG